MFEGAGPNTQVVWPNQAICSNCSRRVQQRRGCTMENYRGWVWARTRLADVARRVVLASKTHTWLDGVERARWRLGPAPRVIPRLCWPADSETAAKRLGLNSNLPTTRQPPSTLSGHRRSNHARRRERAICAKAGVSGVGTGSWDVPEPVPALTAIENHWRRAGQRTPIRRRPGGAAACCPHTAPVRQRHTSYIQRFGAAWAGGRSGGGCARSIRSLSAVGAAGGAAVAHRSRPAGCSGCVDEGAGCCVASTVRTVADRCRTEFGPPRALRACIRWKMPTL